MRNIPEKVDNSTNPIERFLTAPEFNDIPSELEHIITAPDGGNLTLDENNTTQLKQAVMTMITNGLNTFRNETGVGSVASPDYGNNLNNYRNSGIYTVQSTASNLPAGVNNDCVIFILRENTNTSPVMFQWLIDLSTAVEKESTSWFRRLTGGTGGSGTAASTAGQWIKNINNNDLSREFDAMGFHSESSPLYGLDINVYKPSGVYYASNTANGAPSGAAVGTVIVYRPHPKTTTDAVMVQVWTNYSTGIGVYTDTYMRVLQGGSGAENSVPSVIRPWRKVQYAEDVINTVKLYGLSSTQLNTPAGNSSLNLTETQFTRWNATVTDRPFNEEAAGIHLQYNAENRMQLAVTDTNRLAHRYLSSNTGRWKTSTEGNSALIWCGTETGTNTNLFTLTPVDYEFPVDLQDGMGLEFRIDGSPDPTLPCKVKLNDRVTEFDIVINNNRLLFGNEFSHNEIVKLVYNASGSNFHCHSVVDAPSGYIDIPIPEYLTSSTFRIQGLVLASRNNAIANTSYGNQNYIIRLTNPVGNLNTFKPGVTLQPNKWYYLSFVSSSSSATTGFILSDIRETASTIVIGGVTYSLTSFNFAVLTDASGNLVPFTVKGWGSKQPIIVLDNTKVDVLKSVIDSYLYKECVELKVSSKPTLPINRRARLEDRAQYLGYSNIRGYGYAQAYTGELYVWGNGQFAGVQAYAGHSPNVADLALASPMIVPFFQSASRPFQGLVYNRNNQQDLVEDIVGGYTHTLFKTESGQVYVCGYDTEPTQSGISAQGTGNPAPMATVIRFGGSASTLKAKKVFSNSDIVANIQANAFVIDEANALWFWGYHANYDVSGEGLSGVSYIEPRNVTNNVEAFAGKTPIKAASCGDAFVVLFSDFTLWAIGSNVTGWMGLGNTTPRTEWTQIASGVRDFAFAGQYQVGEIALYIISGTAGTILASGQGTRGSLGNNNTANSNVFVNTGITIGATGKIFVGGSTSGFSVYAITNTNQVYVWGNNTSGQLGLASTTDILVPTLNSSLTTLAASEEGIKSFVFGQVASNGSLNRTFILFNNGTVYSAGYNTEGGLGLGTLISPISEFTRVPFPELVSDICLLNGVTPITLALGYSGKLYTAGGEGDESLVTGWGSNNIGGSENFYTPQRLLLPSDLN